jgi:hypothetical protein
VQEAERRSAQALQLKEGGRAHWPHAKVLRAAGQGPPARRVEAQISADAAVFSSIEGILLRPFPLRG